VASPTMKHKIENDNSYVWISHSKILEDLPILDIGSDRLKRILKHLVDVGLVETTKSLSEMKGTRTYFKITEKCEQLKYTDQVLKTTLDNERPSVEKNTSDNKLNINNKKNTTKVVLETEHTTEESNFLGSVSVDKKEKPKKKNLFEKCLDIIDEYTVDGELRDLLITYLKYRLEIKDKPLYANMWKGMINKLRKLDNNDYDTACAIVQQSINRGYLGFFPVNNYSGNIHNKVNESGASNVPHITQEEKEELDRMVELGELQEF
jgi:hypothetical protein